MSFLHKKLLTHTFSWKDDFQVVKCDTESQQDVSCVQKSKHDIRPQLLVLILCITSVCLFIFVANENIYDAFNSTSICCKSAF